MKNARSLPLLALLLALLPSCRLETPWFGSPAAAEAPLPADKVLDVSRALGGPFQFQTLLPVQLHLTVDLYRQSPAPRALEKLPAAGELVVVSLDNSRGERLYSGRVSAEGTLSATLALPAAPEDVLLSLEAPGFESRRVTLKGMVQYAEVNRVMGLLAKDAAAKAETLPDRDFDGIPDVYDAYPDDPDAAFCVRNPAAGWLTVAFEDLYLVKNAGDADYNDFVAKYFVEETYAGSGQTDRLARLTGQAVAAAKIAGYNHKFGILFDFPGAAAELTVHGFNSAGLPKTTTAKVQDKAVVWLFDSTKSAVGKTAEFTLEFPEPIARGVLSLAPYDPFLYVLDTGKDVHLIGRDPLPKSNNPPGSDFQDDAGFPWALLVPEEWRHPAETQYIGQAYPLFDAWRTSFGASASDWYLHPAAVTTDIGNHAPYPVTGPTATPVFTAGTAASFQLGTTAPPGLPADPDGDQVYYRSSAPPAALAGKVSLDEASGLVSFAGGVEAGAYLLYFWNEDEHGASTIASPYKVSFTFQAKAVSYQRLIVETYPPLLGAPATDTALELYDGGGKLAWDDNNPLVPFMHQPSAMIDYRPAAPLAKGTVLFIRIFSKAGNPGPYSIRVFALDDTAALPAALPAYAYSGYAWNSDDTPYEEREAALDGDPWNDLYPAADQGPAVIGLDAAAPLHRYLGDAQDSDWVRVTIP